MPHSKVLFTLCFLFLWIERWNYKREKNQQQLSQMSCQKRNCSNFLVRFSKNPKFSPFLFFVTWDRLQVWRRERMHSFSNCSSSWWEITSTQPLDFERDGFVKLSTVSNRSFFIFYLCVYISEMTKWDLSTQRTIFRVLSLKVQAKENSIKEMGYIFQGHILKKQKRIPCCS